MNTITSFIGRTCLGALAALIMAGVLIASSSHDPQPCTVLRTVCAANPSGVPLCSTQRCPGECQCCMTTDTNVSGRGFRIRLGGRWMFCNTWSGPCSSQPTWCSNHPVE